MSSRPKRRDLTTHLSRLRPKTYRGSWMCPRLRLDIPINRSGPLLLDSPGNDMRVFGPYNLRYYIKSAASDAHGNLAGIAVAMPDIHNISREKRKGIRPDYFVVVGHLSYGARSIGQVAFGRSLVSPIGIIFNTIWRIGIHEDAIGNIEPLDLLLLCTIAA